jgi:hypothetical protein
VREQSLKGYWFDRTQEYAARRRGETFDRLRYATPETILLSPLPCWKHLSAEEWRKLNLNLIREIGEAADARSRAGNQPLGASAIRRAASLRSTGASEAIASTAVPFGEPYDVQGALDRLCLVRRDLPASRGKAPSGRPHCRLSERELPTGDAIR